MAKQDFTESENELTISKNRQMLALEATWEIEQLCKMLRTCVQPNERMEEFVVRGLSARIDGLSKIIMGALCDASETTSDLAFRLRLKREEEPA